MYNRAVDVSLLLLRIVFGGAMLFAHGWGKLMRFFDGRASTFADPLGIGSELSLALTVFAEVGCAILLMIGLFTRFVTVPLIITMLVAMLIVHGDDPFSDQEKALLFMTGYLAIFIAGPGWISLDGRLRNRM